MQISNVGRLALVAAAWALMASAAVAQAPPPPPDNSNVTFSGMLKGQKAPTLVAPSVPAPPSAWPRLDPGSVICRTEGDLKRRAAQMLGEQTGPADCQPVTQPTAIQIVHRFGPGATEVRISSNNETVWTDAWLPAKPPPGITATSAQQ